MSELESHLYARLCDGSMTKNYISIMCVPGVSNKYSKLNIFADIYYRRIDSRIKDRLDSFDGLWVHICMINNFHSIKYFLSSDDDRNLFPTVNPHAELNSVVTQQQQRTTHKTPRRIMYHDNYDLSRSIVCAGLPTHTNHNHKEWSDTSTLFTPVAIFLIFSHNYSVCTRFDKNIISRSSQLRKPVISYVN